MNGPRCGFAASFFSIWYCMHAYEVPGWIARPVLRCVADIDTDLSSQYSDDAFDPAVHAVRSVLIHVVRSADRDRTRMERCASAKNLHTCRTACTGCARS